MAHFTEFQDKLVKTDRLRSLFDQVLWSINKDVIWGFPPRLSDGVEADLFTLFWVVRKIGDYELVSKNELWEFVAKECGLGTAHVASLQLIYIKYLKELDQWLTHGGFKDMKLDNGDLGVLEKLDSLFHELKGFQGNVGNEGFEEKLDLDIAKTETRVSRINNVDEKDENFSGLDEKKLEFKKVDVLMIKDDDDKRVSVQSKINKHNNTGDNDSNNNYNNNVVSSQKRKQAESLSLSKMLNWVVNAARNPHDVGSIPNSSKWKKYKGNEVWKQVLCVKERLFAKPNVDSGNKVYGPQKKRHMMHPSMYEDDKIPVHLSSKRMRCSQRVSSVKSCSCPGCTSCSSSRTKRVKKTPQILPTVEIQDDTCEDEETESVNVRAEVPEWTGFVSESDLKWLGTRMWPPPEGKNGKCDMGFGVVGKGRKSKCTCLVRGSADCVRVHIGQSRTKVKRELGQIFYKWKFHHMGEEAAVSSWSVKEESEFKSLVVKARQELADKSKSRHEIMNNFWTRASESIPCKTKDLLVRYYFNVFMLRRRSFQNRVMPENIDSDDDEQDVGHEKIDALSIKNAPCMNLDEHDVGCP
ncbi:AT-rich interactive domain-containing protein 2-like [Bidens hawaiensis]|uniref:AT-rich interactive domain-containing protein 2-like n=1 Tax=Bidens hawaiensis TaxID=980011 RepID=UPI004049888E